MSARRGLALILVVGAVLALVALPIGCHGNCNTDKDCPPGDYCFSTCRPLLIDAGIDASTIFPDANTTDARHAVDAHPKDAQTSDRPFDGPPGTHAVLLLNELQPNLSTGDLIELRATSGGDIGGIVIKQNPAPSSGGAATLATLPTLTVATGDLVVVHLTPGTVTNETTAGGKMGCSDGACYSMAWDVVGSTGMTFSQRVIALIATDGTVMDSVPFNSTSTQTDFATNVTFIQAAARGTQQWMPSDCGGSTCTAGTVSTVSFDWSGLSVTTMSAQRINAADNNDATDWMIKTSTFGLAN